jgi:hypothetical protein
MAADRLTPEAFLAEARLLDLADTILTEHRSVQLTEALLRKLLSEAEAHAEETVVFNDTLDPFEIVSYVLKLRAEHLTTTTHPPFYDVIEPLPPEEIEIEAKLLQARNEHFPSVWSTWQSML